MLRPQFKSLGAIVLLFALSLFAYAQSQVRLELSSYKVITTTDAEGHRVESFKPALNVAPGDVIEWRLRAINTSDKILQEVSLIIPIPAKTYYLKGSASTLVIERGDEKIIIKPEFSYDGGQTYGIPPLFKIVKEVVNGQEVTKKVPVAPEEYTHVRWVLKDMLPKEAVEVFLRTVVR